MTRPFRAIAAIAAFAAAAATLPAADLDLLALMTGMGMVNGDERSAIESGGAVVTIMPARGRDLAAFGITRTSASGSRLIAWTREIERLYRGRYIPAIGRFSAPPRLEDLSALTLDDDDLGDLRKCRPGDCDVKLSDPELDQIRRAAADGAGDRWEEGILLAFRQVVLARAQSYLAAGLTVAPPYHDRKTPISPDAEFAEVTARVGLEPIDGARALRYFHSYPAGDAAGVESLLYWSRETLGGGKPIVSITHVAIFRNLHPPLPYAAVAARQVYASHYLTASLSFTIIVGGLDAAPHYLVYLRRLRTDAFERPFGRFIRTIVERRIRSEAPAVLDGLRRTLEGGDPPRFDSTS